MSDTPIQDDIQSAVNAGNMSPLATPAPDPDTNVQPPSAQDAGISQPPMPDLGTPTPPTAPTPVSPRDAEGKPALWQTILMGALAGLAGSAGGRTLGQQVAGGAAGGIKYGEEQKQDALQQQQQDNANQQQANATQNQADIHQMHLANGLLTNMQIQRQWETMHPDLQKQVLDTTKGFNATLQENGVKPTFTGSEDDATAQAQKLVTSADPSSRFTYRVLPSVTTPGQFDVMQVPTGNTSKPVPVQTLGPDGKITTQTAAAGTPWSSIDAANTALQKTNMDIGADKLKKQNDANIKAAADAKQNAVDKATQDSSIVDGMIDGSLDVTKLAGLRGNSSERERLVALAKAKDPSFNMNTYAQRLQTNKYFSPGGKGNDQIVALNTFAGHVGEANDGIQSLNNFDNQYANKSWNSIAEKLGNTAVAPQRATLEAAKDEYLNFLKAGHAPQEAELKLADTLLSTSQTPAQTQEVLRQMAKVVQVRTNSLAFGYERTMGKPMENLYDPNTIAVFSKFGIPVQNNSQSQSQSQPQGNVAPEGTIINVNGQQQIKQNGKWVPKGN